MMLRSILLAVLMALQSTIAISDVTPASPYEEIHANYDFMRGYIYKVTGLYMADASSNTMAVQAPSLADDTWVLTLPGPAGWTFRGDLLLQNTAGSQPTVKFSEDPDNGTNAITVQAPASIADFSLTLPPDDGDSGEVLSTNGSGVLDWVAPLTNPMDSPGDMIWGDTGGAATKLDSGTAGQWLVSGGAATPAWTNTVTTGKMIDGSADEIQLTVQGHSTQTSDLLMLENSAGLNVLNVSNIGDTTIGTDAVAASTGLTVNKVRIGNGDRIARFFYDATLNGTGQVGVIIGTGDASPASFRYIEFQHGGDETTEGTLSGYVANTGDTAAVGYATSSDARMKEDIHPSIFGLSTIMDIEAVDFKWKPLGIPGTGFIAQDLNEIYPHAVYEGTPGDDLSRTWAVDYGKLTPVLVKAIQEQQAVIESLAARIAALEKEKKPK